MKKVFCIGAISLIFAAFLPTIAFGIITESGAMQLPRSTKRTGWVHLELGAANYNPKDDTALVVLENFLEDYVRLNGSRGTIILNDLPAQSKGLKNAAKILKRFATKKGWKDLKFELLEGDFTSIPLSANINTISLRNPELPLVATSQEIAKTVALYKHFANKAKDGFLITSYFYLQMLLLKEYGNLNIQSYGKGAPYRLPDGWQAPNSTFNFVVSQKQVQSEKNERSDDATFTGELLRKLSPDAISYYTQASQTPKEMVIDFPSSARKTLRQVLIDLKSKNRKKKIAAEGKLNKILFLSENLTAHVQAEIADHAYQLRAECAFLEVAKGKKGTGH